MRKMQVRTEGDKLTAQVVLSNRSDEAFSGAVRLQSGIFAKESSKNTILFSTFVRR
jgi:hypothetical protein